MIKQFVGLLMILSLIGCSQVISEVSKVAREDFNRTVVLAEKYGKPEVKQCFVFLASALDSIDKDSNTLDVLLAEETSGIASSVLKAVLIKEAIQALNDPIKQAAFEKDFQTNCQAVSGQIMLNIMKDARSSVKRLPGIK